MGGYDGMGEGGSLGLTWVLETSVGYINALFITRGSQKRSYRPQKRAGASEKSEKVIGDGDSPGTHSTA